MGIAHKKIKECNCKSIENCKCNHIETIEMIENHLESTEEFDEIEISLDLLENEKNL